MILFAEIEVYLGFYILNSIINFHLFIYYVCVQCKRKSVDNHNIPPTMFDGGPTTLRDKQIDI